ncbi:MAG: UDP-N-acetylmuramoyl-tripeptide--D-alanyl-D-alanine ligase [Anaerolineales bacterium]
MLKLADTIEAVTGTRPPFEIGITEAAIDSRQVIPGSMFIAIPGEHVDGHDFVTDAFQRGASLALIQHKIPGNFQTAKLTNGQSVDENIDLDLPLCLEVENTVVALQQIARFWRRKLHLRVIGVTGSVGKSTTKEVIAEVLDKHYHTLKSPGNMNNEIGLPLTILKIGPGTERAVLEMGFYIPGEIALLCDIALPEIGVVTNIGTVHAERAGSQEDIFRGKSELVRALPASGVAILNKDDPWVRKMADISLAKVFFYGLDPASDLWADELESFGLEGIRFQLHYNQETMRVNVPMIGRHSVLTAMRAAAVGLVDGLTWQEILEGLQQGHSQLRLTSVRTENGALILDDSYNATPESMIAALNLLGELEGRKVAVLGDMLELGQYEKLGHEMVGVRASELVDLLITVGIRGHLIAAAAQRAGLESHKIVEFENQSEVIKHLRKHLSEGDVVLIKGSHGLRMDRIVSALEVPE